MAAFVAKIIDTRVCLRGRLHEVVTSDVVTEILAAAFLRRVDGIPVQWALTNACN
jgi:hypothetical protein